MNKKEQRARLIAEMREMDAKAKEEKRAFTDEENKAFSDKEAEVRELDKAIAEEERAAKLAGFTTEKPAEAKAEPAKRDNSFMRIEKRSGDVTLSVGTADAQGSAYALAPEEFVNELLKEVEKECLIFPRVRKVPVSGAGSLGIPQEEADASDAGWTNEIPDSEITADTSWKFGKRELAPTDLVKLIKFTKKLLATSALPVESLTREKIAQKMSEAFEQGILTGDGNNCPLGVFTASDKGIPADRDIPTTGSGTGVVTADDLINMKMKLRPAYRRNAVWVMSTALLTQVMKLKDGDDRYLWQPAIKDGEPSTILGLPVIESEFVPDATTAGSYLAVLGDFSKYWFAYWKGVDIQVFNEKFSLQNQIGIGAHTLADGQPVLPAAFVRLKSATAS